MNLAKGYLAEAEEDFGMKRWRSCAAGSQLAIENSAKAIIACFVPVALTHDPAPQLAGLLEAKTMPREVAAKAKEIIPIAAKFSEREHALLSDGDMEHFRDPWSLITESKAKEALDGARRCVKVAKEVYERLFG